MTTIRTLLAVTFAVIASLVGNSCSRQDDGKAQESTRSEVGPAQLPDTPVREDMGAWRSVTIDHLPYPGKDSSPVYSITVEASGIVRYHGSAYVETSGDREVHISAEALRAVEMIARPFMEMKRPELYQYPMFHMSETVVTVVTEKRTAVVHLFVVSWDDRHWTQVLHMPDYAPEFWYLTMSAVDAIEELSGCKPLAGVR